MLKSEDKKKGEREQLAERLKEALKAPGMRSAVAEACEVTDQAITGWLRDGRIHKRHLPVIERLTRYRLTWLLTGEGLKHWDDSVSEEGRNPDDMEIDSLTQRRQQIKMLIDRLDENGLDAIQEEFEKIERIKRRRRERAEENKKTG